MREVTEENEVKFSKNYSRLTEIPTFYTNVSSVGKASILETKTIEWWIDLCNDSFETENDVTAKIWTWKWFLDLTYALIYRIIDQHFLEIVKLLYDILKNRFNNSLKDHTRNPLIPHSRCNVGLGIGVRKLLWVRTKIVSYRY